MPINFENNAAETANTLAKPQIFFSSKSGSSISTTFEVNKEPWYVEAFNLDVNDTVTVQQVAGPGSGTFFKDYQPGAVKLQLTATRTKVRIDWPGQYRLVFAGTSVTAVYVLGFPGTMTQETIVGYDVTFGSAGQPPPSLSALTPIVITGAGTTGNPYVVRIAGLSGLPATPIDPLDSAYIGSNAGTSATGTQNVFVGTQAGASSTGNDNVFVGRQAGDGTTMSSSVCVGLGAGLSNTGTGGIFIGTGAGAGDGNSNVIAIGATPTAPNQAVLGDNTITELRTAGSVISGGVIGPSDSRLKKNLNPLRDAIKTIAALNVVEFSWDEFRVKDAGLPYIASDFTKRQTGVIAQDIEKILPQCVQQVQGGDGELYKFVHYDRLIPFLIAAIQEQAIEIAELKSRSA
jgi:hypothetical protein